MPPTPLPHTQVYPVHFPLGGWAGSRLGQEEWCVSPHPSSANRGETGGCKGCSG